MNVDFDDVSKESSPQKVTRYNKATRGGRALSGSPKGQNIRTLLESATARVEKGREFRAQHGPVRVLFKDGKPVEQ